MCGILYRYMPVMYVCCYMQHEKFHDNCNNNDIIDSRGEIEDCIKTSPSAICLRSLPILCSGNIRTYRYAVYAVN